MDNTLWLYVFAPINSGGVDMPLDTVLLNLIGIDSQFNWYSWFVYFFIYAMIVMPFVSRFIDRRPVVNTIIAIVIAFVMEVAVHSIPGVLENKPLLALFNCFMMTPGMLLGYLFAKQGVYERITIKNNVTSCILGVLMIILPLIPRYYILAVYGFDLDFFYAPVVIGGIVILFSTIKMPILSRTLQEVGKVSVWMWFLHALFYTAPVRPIYQPAITIFQDINLVVIWTILLTFVIALFLNKVSTIIQRKVFK